MLGKNAKVELLRRVPLFAQCSAKQLGRIAGVADELTLPAGRTLAKEGASGREFVVIVEGAAEVKRDGRRLNTLRSGDFLGEIALLADRPRTATVTTTAPSRVLVLTARDFRALLRDVPSLPSKVLAAVAVRLKDLD